MQSDPTWCLGVLAALCLIGCAKRPMLDDPKPPVYAAERGELDTSEALEPGVYSLESGERLRKQELFTALEAATFIVVGEQHDDAFHHHVQGRVYEALTHRAKARGAQVLLGLEMVQVPFQPGLDAYVQAEVSEEEMLERVEWSTRWGYPHTFYAPMWELARANEAPLIALNAPRELSRRISQVGIKGLSDEERAILPGEMNLDDAAHRTWFEQMFLAHGGMSMEDRAMFERFYEAQVSWDETMAQSAAQAMSGRAKEDQMVILAGAGHVAYEFGIPSRLERRLEKGGRARVVTIIPVSAPGAAHDLGAPSGATLDQLAAWRESNYADYIWVQ